ncbi:M20 family metallo-hydrolase [Frigidibacter mobilis]|uniref:Allantoate amidohydrolase n=1 Tax=Frigidibacter mobilis TaxID=1335048 RepID=A0A159Z701_9RHOB|nr:M20 family metallo-hydrolase [Frigidibacter mobilis]AMY70320.1 allantoate amidohydrolase [Frigidibacter mobilis]
MSFAADFVALKQIGADPAGGWSRLAFSAADNAAHDWLLEAGRAAGLAARYDAFGNAILRLEGTEPRPALLIGSHLDTVRNGGAFDGAIGVLAGLEILRRLRASGQPGAPVEAISFRDEEGRFGPFTGSRAMMGQHDPDALAKARAADGEALAEVMAGSGFSPANAPRALSGIAGYLELHIEQGPVLEQAGCPLGIVTAIAGQERLSLRFTGQADHAGTAPMDLRRDAFAGAARFATAFRDLICAAGDPALRGTIGVVKLSPNQGNVVPGEVTLGLEIRSTDGGTLPRLRQRVLALAQEIAGQEQLGLRIRALYSESPVPMDPALQEALVASAAELGHRALCLPSGANHDAGILGRLVPSAMIFVPSIGGRSHCPEEETGPAPIEAAIDVLHHAVMTLRRARA